MAITNNVGSLKIQITNNNFFPVEGASVYISPTGMPDSTSEEFITDENGIVIDEELPAPDVAYSLEPGDNQPYAEYNVLVNAPGYNERFISGVQIFSGENGIQNIELTPSDGSDTNPTVLDAHTLWEQYPPKIAEDMIKPVNPSGGIVLSRVVVPETIVVHDGAPADSTARDYYVPYKDYIKNVACNEIYSTWPDAAIRANVLAIQSFTLNRVYTEWYRGKGYDFTITSNTAFDQKWVYNATIFENVSQIVDEMFANYLSKPNVTQPLFTQYCDGRRVSCPGWMTQWGSCSLGEQGYSAIEILRRFYGNSIYINTAEQISGIPISYPGEPLKVGSSGDKVRQLQQQLDAVATVYYAGRDLRIRNGGVRTGVPVGVWTSADGRGRFCYLVQDFSYLCGDLADCGAELSWKWDLREKNNEKTYEFI